MIDSYQDIQSQVQSDIQDAITKYANGAMFGVAKIPAHVHNGVDSSRIAYSDLSGVVSGGAVCGTFLKALNDPATNQTIAHGLGKKPSLVCMTGYYYQGSYSTGFFNGTTMSCAYASTGFNFPGYITSNYIINIMNQYASITVDEKNIYLSWTAGGATNANASVVWSAQ